MLSFVNRSFPTWLIFFREYFFLESNLDFIAFDIVDNEMLVTSPTSSSTEYNSLSDNDPLVVFYQFKITRRKRNAEIATLRLWSYSTVCAKFIPNFPYGVIHNSHFSCNVLKATGKYPCTGSPPYSKLLDIINHRRSLTVCDKGSFYQNYLLLLFFTYWNWSFEENEKLSW